MKLQADRKRRDTPFMHFSVLCTPASPRLFPTIERWRTFCHHHPCTRSYPPNHRSPIPGCCCSTAQCQACTNPKCSPRVWWAQLSAFTNNLVSCSSPYLWAETPAVDQRLRILHHSCPEARSRTWAERSYQRYRGFIVGIGRQTCKHHCRSRESRHLQHFIRQFSAHCRRLAPRSGPVAPNCPVIAKVPSISGQSSSHLKCLSGLRWRMRHFRHWLWTGNPDSNLVSL